MQIRWKGVLMDDITVAQMKQDVEILIDALAKQNQVLIQMSNAIQALNQRCSLASERIMNLEVKTSGTRIVNGAQGQIWESV